MHTAAALRSDLVGKDEVSAVFCSADSKSLLELCPDGARRKGGGGKSIPCSSGWKLPAFTIKCLVCVMLGSPCYAALPFPKAQHLGAGSEVLCHCQQEGPCQVNGSLAVAAVGSLLFSCLAFAFRLGSLLSSVLIKAVGSSEAFASQQQAAAHPSSHWRALWWRCNHSQGRRKGQGKQGAGRLAPVLTVQW